jgi:hypothetical protein
VRWLAIVLAARTVLYSLLSTSITTNNAELEQLLNKHMTDLHYLPL